VRDFSALDIGYVMAVTGLAQFAMAPVAGRLSTRVDLRWMLALGMALFALGSWLNGFLTHQSGLAELALPQAVRGVALLLCFIPINRLSLGTLPPSELKNASGVFNLTRNLGGAVGLALLSTFLDHREQHHWNRLAADIDPTRPEVGAVLEALAGRFAGLLPGDPDLAALRQVALLVEREATVLTFNDAFLLVSLLFAAALALTPLIRKPRPSPPPPAGEGH
jgi:MFS transporter, DHA2 family, multidrug resistance protein